MKKALALVMSLIMALSLGACGQTGDSSSTVTSGGNADGLSGELTVWAWDLSLAYLSDVGEKFMEDNPGVTIHFEEMGTDQVYNKLTTSLASGVGLPDLVVIEGEQMSKFGGKFPDSFLDLTEEINPDDYLPIKVAEATTNGKILAYPWDAAPNLMFYRTDMYEKAGIDPSTIKTWDDFIEAGIKVQDANPDVSMMPLATSRRDHIFRILMMQQGSFYFDEEGNSCMNTPEAIGAMELMKKMYDAGITADETSWDDYVTKIAAGRFASVPDGIWMAGTIADLAPEDAGKWGVMPMPQYNETTTGESSNGGSLLAIPATTEYPELAKAFAKYAMTDLDNLAYGLETYGFYPSYLPAFEMDVFENGNDYLGGAKLNAMYSETAPNIPHVNYTVNFAEATETSKNAVAKILLKNEDITATMDDLQDEFVAKFGQ